MVKKFRDAEIFYRFLDKKSEVVNVYLHGWGCDHKTLFFCHKFLKNQSSLFIDFPPFGQSSKTISDWTVFTYANMVMSICSHLGIKKFNLIGHSFGGRIAIILAVLCKDETQKLVLVDSAGLKPHRNFRYFCRKISYKIKKWLKKDVKKYESEDYRILTPNMRPIFCSIVSTYLDDFLPFIKAKTLIIFGENDRETPIYMAKKMHKKIKGSRLVILEDAGHFCFLDKKLAFLLVFEGFIKN